MNYTKLKLTVTQSSGQTAPISEEALQIIYDNLPISTGQEAGTKLMISMCLHGIEHENTQALAVLCQAFMTSVKPPVESQNSERPEHAKDY